MSLSNISLILRRVRFLTLWRERITRTICVISVGRPTEPEPTAVPVHDPIAAPAAAVALLLLLELSPNHLLWLQCQFQLQFPQQLHVHYQCIATIPADFLTSSQSIRFNFNKAGMFLSLHFLMTCSIAILFSNVLVCRAFYRQESR